MKITSFDTPSTDPAPSPTSFAGQVAAVRAHIEVQVPRTNIVGKMRVLSRHERMTVRVEARDYLRRLGLDGATIETTTEWHEEIATRTIAVAMRAPGNLGDTLATLEAWNTCDVGQIDYVWQQYRDLQDRLDPLGEHSQISEQEIVAIEDAAKKKARELLMSFGSFALASYVITTAGQPKT
ncbi:MAG: hypothetical protein ACRDBH_01440 [Bosea sp. (in: a-proteobacteria)]